MSLLDILPLPAQSILMSYVFFVTRRVRLFRLPPKPSPISACILRHLSAAVPSTSPEPKPSLSARLSLVFDQIDALERQRDIAAKDEALQRIRAWRQTKDPITPHSPSPSSVPVTAINGGSGLGDAQVTDDKDLSNFGMRDIFRREVEVVHPWPEWIELLERLAGQNYFDYRRVEEEHIAANVGIDLSGVRDEVGLDLSRDWAAVRTACMNFGRDRFDILKSLSRKDIQTLVGHGCPSMDPKVVFSAKLLRKYVHVDEGDVCSSCSLRNTCSRGYLLVPKEDEARTLDVMRILLTYAFDHIKESIANAPLRKMKTVKTVVRKLLHEVVKLSAVPRDPNLLPPAIKKPPPKVKQPPPQPKRRVGRDDVEMKKGDWLCTKCDFMNFAKNTVCLQCDAKRPKRQLLPGEWECPKCNFLNYRRNMSCFQCEHTRPPDEFTENQMQGKRIGPTTRLQRAANTSDVSNAWNLAFDDDESDGADVAAFEFADSSKARDGSFNEVSRGGSVREIEGDDGMQNLEGGRYFSTPRKGGFSSDSHATGFDDFDDEEDGVDSYELDKTDGKGTRLVSQNCLSEFDDDSGLENCDDVDDYVISKQSGKDYLSNSEDDDIRVTSQKIEDSRRQFKFGDEDLSGSNHDMRDNRGSKGQKVGRRNIGVKGSMKQRDSSFSDGSLDSDFNDEDDDNDDLYHNRSKMKGNRGVAKRKVRNTHDSNHFGYKGNGRNYFGRDDDFEENGVHSRRKGHGDAAERRGNRFRDVNHFGSKNAPRNSVTHDDDESDDWEESRSKRRGRSNHFSQRTRGFQDGIGLKRNGHRHKDDNRYPHSGRMANQRRIDYAQNGRYGRDNGRSRGFREDHDFGDDRQRRRVIER